MRDQALFVTTTIVYCLGLDFGTFTYIAPLEVIFLDNAYPILVSAQGGYVQWGGGKSTPKIWPIHDSGNGLLGMLA